MEDCVLSSYALEVSNFHRLFVEKLQTLLLSLDHVPDRVHHVGCIHMSLYDPEVSKTDGEGCSEPKT